jgi:hypothetical protein
MNAVLFREMVSIDYRNLIATVAAIFEKTTNLSFGAHLNGSSLRSQYSYSPVTDL